jgi:hypothetical protein
MSESREFVIRTEDIRLEEILDLFVRTERDLQLVAALKAPTPLIIEGSRGTGKSFLLRVCEQEQLADFERDRVLPVYVSFFKSPLLHTSNSQQFQRWMLARLCSHILRTLYSCGLLSRTLYAAQVLSGGGVGLAGELTRLEKIAEEYERSFRSPGIEIDNTGIPDIEQFRDSVQDLCQDLSIRRINVLFDEAAHIFLLEQQREFFPLFRDLR